MTAYPEPVDPWAGHSREVPIVFRPGGRRPIFGFIYQLNLCDWTGGRPPYIGKVEGASPTAVNTRVHGKSSSAHTSQKSIATDPWKVGILPGRDGWIILERVYATGDVEADKERLRRAEADWIDRRNPVFNDVRPIRPNGSRSAPAASQARTVYRSKVARRKARSFNVKPLLFLLFSAAFTYVIGRLVLAMHLPWDAVPWIAPPVLGVALGWTLLWRLHKAWSRLMK